jgi:hypothetical protein
VLRALAEVVVEATGHLVGVSDDKRRLILHDIVEFPAFYIQHQESFFAASFRKLLDTERDELASVLVAHYRSVILY